MFNTIFDDIYNLNREMSRVLNSRNYKKAYWPEVNIYENQDDYRIVAKLPGVEKSNVNITLKDNSLRLTGKRFNEEGDERGNYLNERFIGDFERNFILNEKIDSEKINAEMDNGLLMIRLPKSPESKPRSITIK